MPLAPGMRMSVNSSAGNAPARNSAIAAAADSKPRAQ